MADDKLATEELDEKLKEAYHKLEEEAEAFKARFKASEKFDLTPHLIDLGWDEPFFGSLSRRVHKHRTIDIPTAGVRYSGKMIQMLWNPIFFNELGSASHENVYSVHRDHTRGILKHEFYHLIFEHITSRIRTPHVLWNIATDLAINSLIPRNELPDFVLHAGELNKPSDALPDYEPGVIAELVASFPRNKSSEWYMDQLMNDPKVQEAMDKARAKAAGEGGDQPGDGSGSAFDKALRDELSPGGQFDNHDGWGDVSDAEKDRLREHMRDVLRECVKEAERSTKGWGSVPSDIQSYLKKLVSNEVDWRDLISQFIGRSRSSQTTSTYKSVNRRQPFDIPGRKRRYTATPALALDQSGSMSNDWIEMLYAEMSNLGNLTSYDILPFDTEIDEENIQTVRRNQQPETIRTKSGGTDFAAPVNYVNDRPGKYDCLFILTDGGCGEPPKCDIPVAYILAPGCEMYGDFPATVIKMTDTRKE